MERRALGKGLKKYLLAVCNVDRRLLIVSLMVVAALLSGCVFPKNHLLKQEDDQMDFS